ncbi:MAG: putative transcriptional regulatory protein [Phycisphaerae bacterium]|nr:MAG: YebC/PmpR family DNA-binding transcriptional regulator [Planctomycetia bacterium]RIK71686.1 MAG: YebC/PmpR family DNA-binding transcriptional regulator [Planctomycetota bacterium]GJQ25375.1 MAG: putative transcriptional regulatory protein [Phycisphaerae bacterium]
MAGHSKWNNIKRKKGVIDARRGRLWSKLARNLIVAAKHGGGDPAANLSLRYAIDKAKEANMPADTIEKAIKKGTGELEAAEYLPVVYEGYGPGGVAFIVDALTDNPHRTAPEIKKIFERGGGNLGATNCVSWNFATKGVFTINESDTTEDALMEIALDAGAEDVKLEGGVFEVTCEATAYDAVKKALEAKKIPLQSAEITKRPGSTVSVDAEAGRRIIQLIEMFEDHDDVQNVYTNFDMSDEIMAKLNA